MTSPKQLQVQSKSKICLSMLSNGNLSWIRYNGQREKNEGWEYVYLHATVIHNTDSKQKLQ
jgi:hypothetical protein